MRVALPSRRSSLLAGEPGTSRFAWHPRMLTKLRFTSCSFRGSSEPRRHAGTILSVSNPGHDVSAGRGLSGDQAIRSWRSVGADLPKAVYDDMGANRGVLF